MYLSDHKLVPLPLTLIEHVFEFMCNFLFLECDSVLQVDPSPARLVEPLRGAPDLHDVICVEIIRFGYVPPLTFWEGKSLLPVVVCDNRALGVFVGRAHC
jgi:hypothetical protein